MAAADAYTTSSAPFLVISSISAITRLVSSMPRLCLRLACLISAIIVSAVFRSTCVFIAGGGVAVGAAVRDLGSSGPYAAPLARVVDAALSGNAALAGRLRPLHAARGNDRTSGQFDKSVYRFCSRIDAATPDLSHPLDGPTMIALLKGRA